MPKNILEVYKDYHLMPSLVEHMLRVTAIISMVCDATTLPVDRESVICAGLLHDMGNVAKIKTGTGIPSLYQPEGEEYWHKIADEFIKKYGSDDHHANIEIAHELGVSEKVVKLIDSVNIERIMHPEFMNAPIEEQLLNYADNRVRPSPHGITSVVERQRELQQRYKGVPGSMSDADRETYTNIFLEIEKKLFANSKIKPEDITNESAESTIEQLREFMVK